MLSIMNMMPDRLAADRQNQIKKLNLIVLVNILICFFLRLIYLNSTNSTLVVLLIILHLYFKATVSRFSYSGKLTRSKSCRVAASRDYRVTQYCILENYFLNILLLLSNPANGFNGFK